MLHGVGVYTRCDTHTQPPGAMPSTLDTVGYSWRKGSELSVPFRAHTRLYQADNIIFSCIEKIVPEPRKSLSPALEIPPSRPLTCVRFRRSTNLFWFFLPTIIYDNPLLLPPHTLLPLCPIPPSWLPMAHDHVHGK